MMNSENAPKEIVQSFIDLVNIAKWLMDKNHQPSVTQELGRLFPSIRGGGKGSGFVKVWAVSLLGLVLVNYLLHQLIQIILVLQHGLPLKNRTIEKLWGSKATSKKLRKSMSHKTTSGKTPSKLAILSRVKPRDFRFVTCFMSFIKFDLPRL